MTPETAALARMHLGAIEAYTEGLADLDARIAEVTAENLGANREAISLTNGRNVAMEMALSTEDTLAVLNHFKDLIIAKKQVHDAALEAL